jgi:4-hydroxybenzoate polyprenyltransferase
MPAETAFVPLAMAHRLGDSGLVADSILAFLAFGLCASSVYLLNDLFDLPADRRHPTKQSRPLASGSVSVGVAALLVPTLFAGSIALALLLPLEFVLVLSAYFAITLAYSLYLKHAVMLDVLVLAGLYTMRLIGGAAATSVTLSFWLLSFAMFLFLSLALAKRFSELDLHSSAHEGIAVRGYRDSDLPMLAQLGSSSAVVSVLVLALYINSDSVSVLYDRPEVIWLLCPLLLYLISRIWLLAHRKMLDEDPVLFIIRDRRSQLLAALGIILLWVAS